MPIVTGNLLMLIRNCTLAQAQSGALVLQEGARKKDHGGQHDPGALVYGAFGKRADHEVTAEDHVQDAGHQELDDLGNVDGLAAPSRAEHSLGHCDIAVPDSNELATLVRLVEAVDEYFAGVAAHVGHENKGEDSPVAAVKHRVWLSDGGGVYLNGVGDVPSGLPLRDLLTFPAPELVHVFDAPLRSEAVDALGRPVRLSTHPDHVPSIFFDRPPCEETVRMLAQAEKRLGEDQALDLRQEPSDGCPSPVHALPGCEVHRKQDVEEEEDGEASLNDEQEEALDLRRKPSNGCPSPVRAFPDGNKASMML
ncbi:uncharacterized protein LOC144160031 [Haemaphysalis longicornis]